MCLCDFRYVVAWLSCCTKIFCGRHKKRFVGVSLADCTLGSRGYFFLMDTDGLLSVPCEILSFIEPRKKGVFC